MMKSIRSNAVLQRGYSDVFSTSRREPMAVLSFASGVASWVYPTVAALVSPWWAFFVLPLSLSAGLVAVWSGRVAKVRLRFVSSKDATQDRPLMVTGLICGYVSAGIGVVLMAVLVPVFALFLVASGASG